MNLVPYSFQTCPLPIPQECFSILMKMSSSPVFFFSSPVLYQFFISILGVMITILSFVYLLTGLQIQS